ncbi:bluetail domain-containing putative surface protein [Nostoc sp. MG11]|uniref:bluetail domain-containing putative surface protein n=1 Tax=Nostoc sp. MG11 TaxID=2721166 RepID=UPI0018670702|nr:bluetail domain-containing putative surface protein [Nostoc sp. MG11]
MTSTTTYTYDANGDRISESIDNNNDVITDSVITYRYNLISVSNYSDNDGTFESVATYTYDGKDTPRAVNAADVAKLGNINILVESQIQSLLNTTTFIANKAATFSLGRGDNQQTFLAINDAINGFSATNDAIIEITGFSGNLAMLAIV